MLSGLEREIVSNGLVTAVKCFFECENTCFLRGHTSTKMDASASSIQSWAHYVGSIIVWRKDPSKRPARSAPC
jgi:hypothetical protein